MEETLNPVTGVGDAALVSLRKNLPLIFRRKDVPLLFGNCIAVGTLANLGRQGPPFFRQGRHVVYERDSFLNWYSERYAITRGDSHANS